MILILLLILKVLIMGKVIFISFECGRIMQYKYYNCFRNIGLVLQYCKFHNILKCCQNILYAAIV